VSGKFVCIIPCLGKLPLRKIIPQQLSDGLEKMVGFRNVLVHEYHDLDIKLMLDVIDNHLDEFIDFTNHIMKCFCLGR